MRAVFIEKYTELKAQVIDGFILLIDAMHSTQVSKVSCEWIKKA
jgi:hypothetical protein